MATAAACEDDDDDLDSDAYWEGAPDVVGGWGSNVSDLVSAFYETCERGWDEGMDEGGLQLTGVHDHANMRQLASVQPY